MLRVALLACVLAGARGLYLPGVLPHEYGDGERVEVKVNKLTSSAASNDSIDLRSIVLDSTLSVSFPGNFRLRNHIDRVL